MTVYAIVPGRPVPSIRVRDERLRVVRRGPVAAVVSESPRGRSPSPANLRRHDRVMRALAGRVTAILPVRFGTSMAEDELTFVLTARRAAFVRALAHVRNRVQMTVRVPGARSPVHDPSPAVYQAHATAATGREYLLTRARQVAAARAVPGFAPIRESVRRWVRDERVERRGTVASVYHLIPRTSADAYRRAVGHASADAGLRVIVTGPWPPYAFGVSD